MTAEEKKVIEDIMLKYSYCKDAYQQVQVALSIWTIAQYGQDKLMDILKQNDPNSLLKLLQDELNKQKSEVEKHKDYKFDPLSFAGENGVREDSK